MEELRAQLSALQARLAEEVESRARREGAPLTRPAGLSPHYGEPAVTGAVTEALRQAGLPGEVSSVDCTEYPCIVYGELRGGGKKELHRLRETAALAEYGEGVTLLRFGSLDPETAPKPHRRFFGIALHAPDPAAAESLKKRVDFRGEQMWEATRPPGSRK